MNISKQNSTNKTSLTFRLDSFFEKNKLVLSILAAIFLLGLPFLGLGTYVMRIIIMIGIYSMLAMGLNILTGYTGQVSFGHAAFFAIGAYVSAILSVMLGWNFFLTATIGGIFSGICGLLLGLPALRLSGSYLSIVTLGFGEIVRMLILNWESITNGPLGIKNIPKPSIFGVEMTLNNNGAYYLMLFLVAICTISCFVIVHSKIGRAFVAIKEDELAATMMGVKTTKYKVLAFVISALISGVAGAFYASFIGFIEPNSFVFDTSVLIISIVILGGMGTTRGMFLGSALLISFPEVARFMMDYRFVVYGIVLVVMMRFRPQGILGWKSELPYKFPKLARKKQASM